MAASGRCAHGQSPAGERIVTSIGQIAGIDHLSATRLRRAGVKTAESFLARIREPEHLRLLSERTGIDSRKLLDMAMSVDLMDMAGMGGRYSALLRAAGIHTMDDLRRYSAEDFLEALTVANHRHRIVKRLPSSRSLQVWIQQAAE